MKSLPRVTLLVTLLLALVGVMSASPAGDTINDFTFYMEGGAGTVLNINAEIYAWSGNLLAGNPVQGAIGAPFYSSPLFTYAASGGIDAVTINTGGTFLPYGNYVALFTISNGYANSNGTVSWLLVFGQNPASGGNGSFSWTNNEDCYVCIRSGDWNDPNPVNIGNWANYGQVVWTANFASGRTFDNTALWNSFVSPFGFPDTATYGETFFLGTPEPGTMVLLGTGLLGFATRLRRRF